jgi:hypothetical protein
LYSVGSQIHISLQPSESAGGGGCVVMIFKYTSPFNHQNRLVLVVVYSDDS